MVTQIPGNIGDRIILCGCLFEYREHGWELVLEDTIKKGDSKIDYTVPQYPASVGCRTKLYGREFIYTEEGWRDISLLHQDEVQRLDKRLHEVQPVEKQMFKLLIQMGI
jgi:hypothetical protein